MTRISVGYYETKAEKGVPMQLLAGHAVPYDFEGTIVSI